MDIVLVGNPNTGKTTLFNSLTKSNEHTGNWHGVTVDSKEKSFTYNKKQFNIVDLPGIYSLSPLSFEECTAVDYLYSHNNTLVVNIVDINNIRRNLFLTIELLQANLPTILVINKTSKIENCIYNISENNLEKILGIKVIKINAENINEVEKLKKIIYNFYNEKQNNKTIQSFNFKAFNGFDKYNNSIEKIVEIINEKNIKNNKINKYFLALKCLENDKNVLNYLNITENEKKQIKNFQNDCYVEEIIEKKYAIIDDLMQKSKIQKKKNTVYGKSKLDRVVLNKFLCLPIFFVIMLCVFYLTFFSVGAFLGEKISYFIQDCLSPLVMSFIKNFVSSKIIIDFFQTAIIGGIGAVFSFLPQIVLLFLFLGILEDSGYLSRVAFSLDDIFSKIGLSGKSVYTLLMGFGCSTSACLTARTMEDKNAKIKTAMLSPYMSCSAKLPIYVVIGGAFFGANNVLVIFALYMLGVVIAMLMSVFYERTFLKSKEQSFILEFPPYRSLKVKRLVKLCLDNIKTFAIRVGTVLIAINVIVWVLSSFSFKFTFVKSCGGISMLESLGKIIAPIFVPLGFGSWGATSALLAGLVAKEIIVSSIAMFNGITNSNAVNSQISKSLTVVSNPVFFTPASAISYMVFCLLYSPCVATISVLNKEVGKKWTIISILVQFFVAYIVALVLYSITNLILSKGIMTFIVVFAFFLTVMFSIIFLIAKFKKGRYCNKCNKCKNCE